MWQTKMYALSLGPWSLQAAKRCYQRLPQTLTRRGHWPFWQVYQSSQPQSRKIACDHHTIQRIISSLKKSCCLSGHDNSAVGAIFLSMLEPASSVVAHLPTLTRVVPLTLVSTDGQTSLAYSQEETIHCSEARLFFYCDPLS